VKIDGQVAMEDGKMKDVTLCNARDEAVYASLKMYVEMREEAHGEKIGTKKVSLMDIATFAARILRKRGQLPDQEPSKEVNAASIIVPVEMRDGTVEEWLFMFKNETHNHPTEIAPFGGASTALGGCIRDPLSGRSYVFMGIRYVGSADPTVDVAETTPGKLSQLYINREAAHGYAAYGNQIGVPTMQSFAVFHEGYKAKRFCCGCVGAATKRDEVLRADAQIGNVVVMVGGRTGRDGIGGATGSSKEHDETSVSSCGAEVQKGNPPEERFLQRLFRNPEAKKMIRLCNDFGAGGVTNAIGEMADGVHIHLERVPLKYKGLMPNEIALSESQERMAVLLDAKDAAKFIEYAAAENLEAVQVAEVIEEPVMRITYEDAVICELDRFFLEGGWDERVMAAEIETKSAAEYMTPKMPGKDVAEAWKAHVGDLNHASQWGMQQMFDSTVGANTLLNPYGGATQKSRTQAAVAKFPVLDAVTVAAMSAGFDPDLSEADPFVGGEYAVVESVARVIASGGTREKTRITLQNYFPRLGKDEKRWGAPLAAQLGALDAQLKMGTPALGGKDSMSGTYMDTVNDLQIDVPPTLVSFAVCPLHQDDLVLGHFQKAGTTVVHVPFATTEVGTPDWDDAMEVWDALEMLQKTNEVLSMRALNRGGLALGLTEMMVGNAIGVDLKDVSNEDLFVPAYGEFLIEVANVAIVESVLPEGSFEVIGETHPTPVVHVNGTTIELGTIEDHWMKPLDVVFPRGVERDTTKTVPERTAWDKRMPAGVKTSVAKPKVVVPIFLGTNCEYETSGLFERAGGKAVVPVFRNKTSDMLNDSLDVLAHEIATAQILAFSGGFSAGDEPDGAGKFIANVIRSPKVHDAVLKFLANDGIILGICNGFQALVKSGLLPYGKPGILKEETPTLAWNDKGHYLSMNVWHKVMSVKSPWMAGFETGEMFSIPIAHGEGRFTAPDHVIEALWKDGQVPFQYTNESGLASYAYPDNPNGSVDSIASITDASGRIMGIMGHPERAIEGLAKNIPFEKKGERMFQAGVDYWL
jgi:phosphoribosylformylglycinamidine synthase